jgi:hypothetical protein|tara:strand:+ start:159 stop:308 length:150 start_codon:yes stop_codon:yes gene_type:complete
MNKKAIFFVTMHPGFMFILDLIIGAVLVYILVAKNIIPTTLLPFNSTLA